MITDNPDKSGTHAYNAHQFLDTDFGKNTFPLTKEEICTCLRTAIATVPDGNFLTMHHN